MLFGQSAGGMSVAGHLTSPPSFGYFSKAISHSGPPVITVLLLYLFHYYYYYYYYYYLLLIFVIIDY